MTHPPPGCEHCQPAHERANRALAANLSLLGRAAEAERQLDMALETLREIHTMAGAPIPPTEDTMRFRLYQIEVRAARTLEVLT